MRVKTSAGLLAATAFAGLLSGCSHSAGGSSAEISIVASTNVYGAIAEQLAAGLPDGTVAVTSIISDAAADPHSYEANPRTELAVSRADLIVENGGGYDDFIDTLAHAAHAGAPVVSAVRLSTHAHDANLNEHVWYDLPTVKRVAHRIIAFLLAKDPADASALHENARAFAVALDRLQAAEAKIRADHDGDSVAITEPVPLYLLQACGLVNRTPLEFSRSVEDGTDASPRVLQRTLNLFTEQRVRLLAYNEQTSDAQTDQVLAAAKANHIAVVPVTETLPAGTEYPTWLAGILRAIAAALA